MTVSKTLSNLSRWPLFVFYSLALYVFFTLPPEQIPTVVYRANDKVLHFLDFYLLTLIAYRTFLFSSQPFFYLEAGRKAVCFSLLYAAFLEWLQGHTPERTASFSDWIAGAVGAGVASLIFRISRLTRSS